MDLNSATAEERRKALDRLVVEGDDRAVGTIRAALSDSHWPLCDEFAAALVRIGGDAARMQLLQALTIRRHHVRSAAVKALAATGGTGVREAIQALVDDPSYEVRQDVTEALERLA